MFQKGIVLAQHKEPALSRKLIHFVNPHVERFRMKREPFHGVGMPSEDAIIQIAQEAGIIDDRTGRPLYEYLARCRGEAAAIVVDAIDDEPYVSSRLCPMLQLQEELVAGIKICEHLCGTNKVRILVYRHLTDASSHIPASIGGYPVMKVRGGYPAKPSLLQLRRLGKGRKLFISVGTAIQLFRAVRLNMRQHTTFITVAGNCVSSPVNMEISIGMTASQALERVGILEPPTHIVCGGPMRGIGVANPENTIILPTTRAVLAIRRGRSQYYSACIGCGRCSQVCPSGLNPSYVHRFAGRGYYARLDRFDVGMCTECGTCSYICPSRQDVVGSMVKARAFAEKYLSATKPVGDDAHIVPPDEKPETTEVSADES
jgi:Na+-translocating ferredoxin:NAD+ oxidoreductase RnfC subunit